MNSTDDIAIGANLDITFRLPHSDREINVHARVAAHQQETPHYNMAFFNVEPKVREELTAFVAAHVVN